MKKHTVLILANKQTTIINFRLEIVEALVKEGYEVFVSLPDGDRLKEIEEVGARVIRTSFDKNGTNPIEDIKLMLIYKKIIKETKADIVLTYTIKPNVYGGMAASLSKIPYIANITGLGTAVQNGGAMQKLTLVLYKIGMRKAFKVFFQNPDNRAFFESHKIAKGKHVSVPGSGVNLNKFTLMEYPPKGTVEFAFISRIMKEKGIEEYIDTARYISKKYPYTVFHVAGFGDEYYENKMKILNKEGVIKYHGLLNDVRDLQKRVHCVIHPTFYPEGMSNILLESAASGRAIISTNRPGSREAIDDGVNGFLIEEQNSLELIKKVEKFLALSYEEKRQMGINGRAKVEQEFDRNFVVKKYLDNINICINSYSYQSEIKENEQ